MNYAGTATSHIGGKLQNNFDETNTRQIGRELGIYFEETAASLRRNFDESMTKQQ